jgi:hypothetical protein
MAAWRRDADRENRRAHLDISLLHDGCRFVATANATPIAEVGPAIPRLAQVVCFCCKEWTFLIDHRRD